MVLKVQGIHKKYGKKQVINNVSFSVDKEEIVALVGPNGAGKTTLFNCISAIGNFDQGSISINNLDIHKDRIAILGKISFMQDSSTLYADLTGKDHLNFIANIRGKSKQEINSLVQELGIASYIDRKVNTYSKGMKQFLSLALAIISQPTLLLMDEPMSGLDPSSIKLFRDKIFQLRSEGCTILFSSHILSEVDRIADRILFIREGELIENRILSKQEAPQSYYTLNIPQYKDALYLLREFEGVLHVERGDKNDIHLTIKKGYFPQVIRLLHENHLSVNDIVKKEHDSEDLYNEIYGSK